MLEDLILTYRALFRVVLNFAPVIIIVALYCLWVRAEDRNAKR